MASEEGGGTGGIHVKWEWVAMFAVSLVVLLVGSLWQEKARQAADDHAELGKVNEKIINVTNEVGDIKRTVNDMSETVGHLSNASNARWGALLEALPDVDKKLRRANPAFYPEWHYDTKTDTPR